MVIGDEGGNLHIYSYSPNSPVSLSGLRLIHRSDFFVSSSPILFLERVALLNKNEGGIRLHTSWCCYGSASGERGLIFTISEMEFKKLSHLYFNLVSQHSMATDVDVLFAFSPGGLNHKEYRTVKCLERRYANSSRNSIDLSFLLRKLSLLSATSLDGLAKASGWYNCMAMLRDLASVMSKFSEPLNDPKY